MSKRMQRGFLNISDGELLGCFLAVAAFFIVVGIVLAIVLPKAWAWFKPILQGWLA